MALVGMISDLTSEELVLMNDMASNPEMYQSHNWDEHNVLCKRNRRCIMCLNGSLLVFRVDKEVV